MRTRTARQKPLMSITSPPVRDEAGEHVAVEADTQEVNRAVAEHGVGPLAVETVDAPRVVAVDRAGAFRRRAVRRLQVL